MPFTDEDSAIAAIAALSELSPEQENAQSKINAILSGTERESHLDIHALFELYNILYFRSRLLPQVEISWSARLTLCAGMCELMKDDQGRYRRIRLKLSESLLKFRPRSDLINTLLHEAIHGYFFVTTVFQHVRDPTGGHGPGFQLLASAINDHGGYNITEFHEFHDEVDSYRTHIWQCDGACRDTPPHFGLVKRTMNRPPGKNDIWWAKHVDECGGTYTKIAEPGLTKKQLDALSKKERAGRQKNKIDGWVRGNMTNRAGSVVDAGSQYGAASKLTGSSSIGTLKSPDSVFATETLKRRRGSESDANTAPKKLVVSCPICDKRVVDTEINEHLDVEHPS